ncbi:MAG: hypothetical protein H6841_08220 [Planctomycetes bacterium]|nr:hypothetical protein [Planctomycetota bacterium]
MQLPVTIKSPTGLLPAAGLLLATVTFGWLAMYCVQMQLAQEVSGAEVSDPTPYWITLAVLALGMVAFFKWAALIARPSRAEVITTRRPLLESEIQRIALKHLMRLEARL